MESSGIPICSFVTGLAAAALNAVNNVQKVTTHPIENALSL